MLLNKWELIDDPDERLDVLAELSRNGWRFIGDAPVLKISALTGKGVHKLRPVLPGRSSSTTAGSRPATSTG